MPRPFNTSQPLGRALEDVHQTVTWLVAATMIPQRTISRYLAGDAEPTHYNAAVIADTLGLDPEDLFPAVYQPS